MKERPILFSAPMVRALLAGTKTQTRRAMKPAGRYSLGLVCPTNGGPARCPYGQPGDRLWVRESHWWFKDEHDPETGYFPPKLTVEDVKYRADGDDGRKVWRPSIHMPRWASRITLDVTKVRVERLQDISEADAIAEGVHRFPRCRKDDDTAAFNRIGPVTDDSFPIARYAALWESINGAGSWDANPWVWVVEFSRAPTDTEASK